MEIFSRDLLSLKFGYSIDIIYLVFENSLFLVMYLGFFKGKLLSRINRVRIELIEN